MELYAIDLSLQEIIFIRQALEIVQIHGKDAKFVADLQTKLEHELDQIEMMKKEAEEKKLIELKEIVEQDPKNK
jgi:hypothetical protein